MKKTLIALLLIAAMLVSAIPAMAEDPTGFTDVPSTHWAYADIMALAKGGLVNGMGDGTFAPNSTLTIAQMAKIICAAKGLGDNASGYWATEYIRICQNDVKCLPNFGEINKANYDVPCTRELAVYMVVEGLGIQAGAKNNGKTSDDIPDWQQIDTRYDEAVVKAVQYGIITGMDDKGTFAPKQSLTRAQVCAILNRAGYTTAAPKATNTAGLENKDIYAKIKATGYFTESIGKDVVGRDEWTLTTIDRKYGGIRVVYMPDTGSLKFIGLEFNDSIVYDEHYNILDENGNIFATSEQDVYYDANGKFVPPSALSYKSRMFLRDLLAIAFPNDYEQVYLGLKECLIAPYHYSGRSEYPSIVLWADGHCTTVYANSGYNIIIAAYNNKAQYESVMALPITNHPLPYVKTGHTDGNFISIEKSYELDKW